MKTKNVRRTVYFLTLTGIIFWISLVFLAPFLKNHSSEYSHLFYSIFSPICHQIKSRSFYAFGYPLSVCARCLGIYTGFLLGTIIYPFINGFSSFRLPKRMYFFIFSIPILTDAAGNILNIWNSCNIIRLIIGMVWGIILPFYFIYGITEAIINQSN